jgi:hypothetical protein
MNSIRTATRLKSIGIDMGHRPRPPHLRTMLSLLESVHSSTWYFNLAVIQSKLAENRNLAQSALSLPTPEQDIITGTHTKDEVLKRIVREVSGLYRLPCELGSQQPHLLGVHYLFSKDPNSTPSDEWLIAVQQEFSEKLAEIILMNFEGASTRLKLRPKFQRGK